MRPTHDPKTEETFFITGDAPDPTGMTDRVGAQAGIDFSKSAIAHPMIRYKDKIIEADLYAHGEAGKGGLMLLLICPRCMGGPDGKRTSRITTERKKIEWDPKHGLSIEAFACPWEMGTDRQMFGLNLCNLKIKIVNNVAYDA